MSSRDGTATTMTNPASPLTPEDFRKAADVSRETLARLELYVSLLTKWQRAINLVSRASLPDVWRRHMLDSAQLSAMAPASAKTWIDLGSGAGFPGLVLAIMGVGDVHLIESDGRKCAFLHEVVRQTHAPVQIHNCRIEDFVESQLCPPTVDVIMARALAATEALLELAQPLASQDTVCFFQKGQDVDNELTKLQKNSNISIEKLPSATNPDSVVLRIGGLGRE